MKKKPYTCFRKHKLCRPKEMNIEQSWKSTELIPKMQFAILNNWPHSVFFQIAQYNDCISELKINIGEKEPNN